MVPPYNFMEAVYDSVIGDEWKNGGKIFTFTIYWLRPSGKYFNIIPSSN